jgi:hypothetical protein
VRGGIFFDGVSKLLGNIVNNDNDVANFLAEWKNFFNILSNNGNNGNAANFLAEWQSVLNILSNNGNNGNDGNDGVNMSDDEINKTITNFMNNTNKTKSGTYIQKPPSELVTLSCRNEDNEPELLYQQFDTIFNNILITINNYVGKKQDEEKSKEFQRIITLLQALPGIDKNLPQIVDTKITPIDRLKIIIELLKKECGGTFKQYICGTALTLISDTNIDKLYKDLINTDNEAICNTHLKQFIKNVIPIMQKQLNGVYEFAEELTELKTLLENLNASSVGGKKSSRSGRKEVHGKQKKIYINPNCKNKNKDIVAKTSHKPVIIAKKIILGKERCIYKIQGSKREHVKYKGSIITVTDYKKLMKVL